MRAVVQRVGHASVSIGGVIKSKIGQGLLILVGVEDVDTQTDADWLAAKIARMRIFADDEGVMNRSVIEVDGEAIVVSQFTLHASTKKGNRPSYIRASKPPHAEPLYLYFVDRLSAEMQKPVGTGSFGADMQIELLNDGPVTLIIDTQNKE